MRRPVTKDRLWKLRYDEAVIELTGTEKEEFLSQLPVEIPAKKDGNERTVPAMETVLATA